MGLKSTSIWFWMLASKPLKSDQNGIEMDFVVDSVEAGVKLKSDQNGIEIREVHISCHSQFFVRIQPNLKILLEK